MFAVRSNERSELVLYLVQNVQYDDCLCEHDSAKQREQYDCLHDNIRCIAPTNAADRTIQATTVR